MHMPLLLRNALALLAGLVIGGTVNMALIVLGPLLIPPPAGVDVTSAESMRDAMHLFQPRHFIMPLLAHAAGTFAGALVAWLAAGSRRTLVAFAVGGVFLLGGVTASFMIPAPTWFIALDIALAYLPMAWLATWAGSRIRPALQAAPVHAA
jgi:hypothetical protein